ncbi:uncharacterized protein DUF4332 [Alteromonadaceae bacterium 2753L.S.0a.02]|nr:uncharacterized protein DUF4332 [Alteromonadaceae bacterium 2753L.S.0a.02]
MANLTLENSIDSRAEYSAVRNLEVLERFQVVGETNIIRNDKGQIGVFTPITGADESDIDNSNLETVVAVLKRSVAELQGRNAELEQELEALKNQNKRSTDEFTSAISHTVDSLQNKLAAVNNPTSRFALKDFKIEATVAVDVSDLGTIDYRFIKPGEQVHPHQVSKVNLAITPIPRETAQDAWTRTDFTPYDPVEEVQGIGEVYGSRLQQEHIYTVSDLMHAGKSARLQATLASKVGVERNTISQWIANAELMSIKSIDGKKAEILWGMGIVGLDALASTDPQSLVEAWSKMNTQEPLSLEQAEAWVATAKAYRG